MKAMVTMYVPSASRTRHKNMAELAMLAIFDVFHVHTQLVPWREALRVEMWKYSLARFATAVARQPEKLPCARIPADMYYHVRTTLVERSAPIPSGFHVQVKP